MFILSTLDPISKNIKNRDTPVNKSSDIYRNFIFDRSNIDKKTKEKVAIKFIDLACKFVEKWEFKFLCSTHWRIIQLKRNIDFAIRRYGGIVWDQIKDRQSLQEYISEYIFETRTCTLLSLMSSQHEILIKQLKYKYFDQFLCVNVSYFDNWLTMWEYVHYPDKCGLKKD